jgi:hypothetical protein
MRHKIRIPALLLALLIGWTTLAAPALAVRIGEGEPAAVRVSIGSVWDWFMGVLTSVTDEARGEIVPDGDGSGGAAPEGPAVPESPTTVTGELPA